jgi:integrase
VKTALRKALVRAGIEDFHFHDLRHTKASQFAMRGGNLYALAMILGHSNPKITIDRYAHLSPEFVIEQRRVMDRTCSSAGNGLRRDTKAFSATSRSL